MKQLALASLFVAGLAFAQTPPPEAPPAPAPAPTVAPAAAPTPKAGVGTVTTAAPAGKGVKKAKPEAPKEE